MCYFNKHISHILVPTYCFFARTYRSNRKANSVINDTDTETEEMSEL